MLDNLRIKIGRIRGHRARFAVAVEQISPEELTRDGRKIWWGDGQCTSTSFVDSDAILGAC